MGGATGQQHLEKGVAEGHRHGQAHRADGLLLQPGHALQGPLALAHQGLGLRQQGTTSGGGIEASGGAVQQLGLQAHLQRPDALGQLALAAAQALGRAGEAAAVTEDGEGSEIGEVVLHRFLLETLDCHSGDLSGQWTILG